MRARRQRLGQHFLNSTKIARRIAECARIDNAVVVEIGSGKGILTEQLAARAQRVHAVEIDTRLAGRLAERGLARVEVICGDFLALSLKDFSGAVVVGNVPYSITTAIIEHLVQHRPWIHRAVLTVQKEYGERIQAHSGTAEYGPLTLFVNYYFEAQKKFAISARFFTPQPQVNSVVMEFERRTGLLKPADEADFFEFVRGLFRYRRKAVGNALFHLIRRIPDTLEKSTLSRRPAQLSFEQLYDLYCAAMK